MVKVGQKKPTPQQEADYEAVHEEEKAAPGTDAGYKKAKASLRGSKGKAAQELGGKATPEDVDVAMGAADNDVDWDAIAIPLNIDKGKHVYRGSLIGHCITSLVALQLKDKLGLEVSEELPANIQNAARAGTNNEAAILLKFSEEFGYRRATYPELEQLKKDGVIAGYNAEMDQIQVRRDVGKKAVLRSHPDAIMTHITGKQEQFFDVEVKFLGVDLFKAFKKSGFDAKGEIWEKYGWQISARIGSHHLPLIFVAAEKLGSETEEYTIGDLIPVVFQPDEAIVPWSDIKAKIKEAEGYVKEGVLPDDCGKGTYGCPAFKLPQCKNPDAKTRVIETVDDTELGELLREQFTANSDKKEAEAILKVVNPKIRKVMEARYPKAEDYAYTVKDASGNEFKWEWIEQERKGYEVEATTISYSKVTLTGKVEAGTVGDDAGDEVERA